MTAFGFGAVDKVSKDTLVINVMDHGAVGDGVTDDTTAIQGALTLSASTGVPVLLPAATYKISSALTLSSKMTIWGQGANSSILSQSSTTANAISGTDLSYVTLRDFGIAGPGSGTGIGISLGLSSATATKRLDFQDIYVHGFGSDGININSPVTSSFRRVTSESNGGHGFNLHGVTFPSADGSGNSFQSCMGLSNTQAGWRLFTLAYTNLTACAGNGNGIGFLVDTCQALNLSSCGAESQVNNGTSYPGTGFKLTGSSAIGVHNGYVYANPQIGIYVTGSTTNAIISGAMDNTPGGGATNFIKVDSGCSATISGVTNTTANSYAAGTVNVGIYNVRTYGAKGDNSTDDTVALQAALTTAATNGGVVYLPAGTYKISSALNVSANTTVMGDGQGTTISQTSTSAHGLYCVDSVGVSIRDLCVKGPGSGTGVGVFFDLSLRSTAYQVSMSDSRGYSFGSHGVQIKTPVVVNISRVVAQTNGGDGFNVSGGGTSVNFNACYGNANTANNYNLNNINYSSMNGCASDSAGAVGYLLTSCNQVVLNGCGCEVPTSYPFEINGGRGVGLMSCYSRGNPSIGAWFTNGTSNSYIMGFYENAPTGTATASIKVDSATTVTVGNFNSVTAASFATGTTTQVSSTTVSIPGSTGTSSNIINRTATSNLASYALQTGGTTEWNIQMRNDSTNDLHIRDGANGVDTMILEQHGTASNVQIGAAKSFGGGVGVIGITNAATVPTTNPTGGVVLYSNAGILVYRDPSGNLHQLIGVDGSGNLTVTGLTTMTGGFQAGSSNQLTVGTTGNLSTSGTINASNFPSGAWTDYSGTFTWTGATTNPAIGNGTIFAKYIKFGRMVTVQIGINAGSTTTFGSGAWSFSLPFACANTSAPGDVLGTSLACYDGANSTHRVMGSVAISGANAVMTQASAAFNGSTAPATGNYSSSVPGTWTTSGYLRMNFTYESTT